MGARGYLVDTRLDKAASQLTTCSLVRSGSLFLRPGLPLSTAVLSGGFALIAWPAVFGSSGIMPFIVGPDGDVYQKGLGPETARIAAAMTAFNPDLTWSRVAVTNE
jgi:hypothetical protein